MVLVSVIIPTFNSASFVIETLRSIENQTWPEIELIITDDCSEDDTVSLCNIWLNEHKSRFARAELLTYHKNSGVPGNANRGLNKAKGEWIKFIGADDTLTPDCIESNVLHISANPDVRVLFSRVALYKNVFTSGHLIKIIPDVPIPPSDLLYYDRDAASQHKMLLVLDRVNYAPSVFINRNVLLSVNGFDERFKLLEDYPLWLKLTKNGFKLYFLNKVTVKYRQHTGAINNTGNPFILSPNYFKTEAIRKIYIYPFLPRDVFLSQRFAWWTSQVFRWRNLNKDIFFNRLVYKLLTTYINPFKYYIHVRKLLFPHLRNEEFYM